MQELCPPPEPPPASCMRGGRDVDIYRGQRRKRNFAALHPHLKMHGITLAAIPAADVLPNLT